MSSLHRKVCLIDRKRWKWYKHEQLWANLHDLNWVHSRSISQTANHEHFRRARTRAIIKVRLGMSCDDAQNIMGVII